MIGLYGSLKSGTGPGAVTRGIASGLLEKCDVIVYGHDVQEEPDCPFVDLGDIHGVLDWVDAQRQMRRHLDEVEVFHSLEHTPLRSDVHTLQWVSSQLLRYRVAPKDFGGYRSLLGDIGIFTCSFPNVLQSYVVCQSPETKRQLGSLAWFCDDIIPLGIDSESIVGELPHHNCVNFLMPGRVSQIKGQQDLLPIDLTINAFGEGTRHLDGVNGMGWVDDPESVYEDHDFALFPSRNETFGMTILEAMSKGCVPIVTERCGISQFDEYSRGMIVCDDVSEMRETIREAHEMDRPEIDEMRQQSVVTASKLTWDNICDRYLEVYDSELSKKTP